MVNKIILVTRALNVGKLPVGNLLTRLSVKNLLLDWLRLLRFGILNLMLDCATVSVSVTLVFILGDAICKIFVICKGFP